VEYTYDVTNPWWTATNIIGRLSMARVWSGSTEIASTIYGYDAMGRVVHQGQSDGTTGVDPQATYDLAGNLSTLLYPSGRLVKYQYDNAFRLNSIVFDSLGGTHIGYSYYSVPTTTANTCPVAATGFYPSGTPAVVQYGNGDMEGHCLNSRLQPTGVKLTALLGSVAQTVLDRTYTYGDHGFNNGNVGAITDNLWNSRHSNDNGRSQYFTYDALNRISLAVEGPTPSVGRWGQGYTTDAWGNLTNIAVTKGVAGYMNSSATPQNRVSGLPYDGAGNLLNTGSFGISY
jgi:hypothetical protein